MTAALVGWYVELARLEPAFAAPGEQPVDALSRVKPLLVVLIDAENEIAVSDLFVARASKREIGVALFSGSADDVVAREWAQRNGIPFFRLPVDLEAFGRVLDQAARASERAIDRRQLRPAVDRAVDGTLVVLDDAGRAWYVYDRRGAERRTEYRAFVSADGVEIRAPLSAQEFATREADALIEQLARARATGG